MTMHSATAISERIQELQWELLELPPYGPDLAPSDFHLFGPLKNHLFGKRFVDDKAFEMEVQEWLRQHSKVFYTVDFDGLVKQWVKCINVGEKCFFQVQISCFTFYIHLCDLFTDTPSYADSVY
jgi:histone-lysine N-methyltransferase SETMAR